jgi:metal-responsive CopG/Arc/MetJ family transcriptional regulator
MKRTRSFKKEVIKVKIPKYLAERFRKYVTEKYGFRKGALSKAIIDLIERELALQSSSSINVDSIVGLGNLSDNKWESDDLVEALRKRINVSN